MRDYVDKSLIESSSGICDHASVTEFGIAKLYGWKIMRVT
jgi:hypothetical protein